jgi:hypothetical protein
MSERNHLWDKIAEGCYLAASTNYLYLDLQRQRYWTYIKNDELQ